VSTVGLEATEQSLANRSWSGAKREPLLVVAACVCGLILLVVLIGPLLAPYPPDQTDILAANQGSSAAHWLGTDAIGRDILSRLLYGARPSLIAAGLVVLLSTFLGTLLAIAAAWYGGWIDRTLMRVSNVLFAIPSVLLAMIGVAIVGAGITAPVLALAIVYSPYIARVGRSVALPERHKPYIEACQLAGFSRRRIWFFHLLPNMRGVLVAQATVGLGFALMDLAAISFIGLGVQPPAADWGVMVSEGRSALFNGYPMEALAAGSVIVVCVVATLVLGERLTARAKDAR
jgi:peptide/nickel transport system permease protein